MSKFKFSNKHREMIRSCVNFALDAANVAITDLVVPFKNGIVIVRDKLSTIDNLWEQKSQVITGYAAQKHAFKETLAQLCWSNMHPSLAFAINTNNTLLRDEMDFSLSELRGMSYGSLLARAKSAVNAITPFLSQLAPYNVTQASIDLVTDAITNLRDVLSTPNNAISHRKTLNEEIQELLRETVFYLKDVMDPLSVVYAETHQQYYSDWKNNRKLKPAGVKITKFRVTVTDELNEPIYNVEVEQNGTTNKTATDINGKATLRVEVSETAGEQPVYEFTLKSGSQTAQTGPVEIRKGHTATRTYVMTPSGFVLPEPAPSPAPSPTEN